MLGLIICLFYDYVYFIAVVDALLCCVISVLKFLKGSIVNLNSLLEAVVKVLSIR